jgi:hypothetical protein
MTNSVEHKPFLRSQHSLVLKDLSTFYINWTFTAVLISSEFLLSNKLIYTNYFADVSNETAAVV